MYGLRTIAFATALTALTSTAAATTLIVEPVTPGITVDRIEYRFVSTRDWLGCWQWDVLQGSGWFRATWWHETDLEADGDSFVAELERNWYAQYCDARMDEINGVWFTWTNPEDPTDTYQGRFTIDPTGEGDTDAVTCALTDADSDWNNFECGTAAVEVTPAGDVAIALELIGL